MADFRLKRVESLLREEISSLILTHQIKDPRVDTLATINSVSVSRDLAYAKVRVSGFLSEKSLSATVAGLNHASGFIQKEIGRKLRFRLTPRLTFVVDPSLEEGFRTNQAIEGVNSRG
jgi:ribosome-binding factor A